MTQKGRQILKGSGDDEGEGYIKTTEILFSSGGEPCEEEIFDPRKKASMDAFEIGEIIRAGRQMRDEKD